MNSFAAVIFDCDGVLVNSEVIAVKAEMAALAGIGLDYAPDVFTERFLGLPERDFEAALDADHRARFGDGLPAGFFEDLHRGKHAAMERGIAAIEGVEAFARSLAVPMAVASSAGVKSLAMKLRVAGLDALFAPHVYSADLVARGKPAPDLFEHAAGRLGADPAACLVIEDSVNGVRAAIAAGAVCWGFTGGGHCPPGHDERLLAAGAHAVHGGFAAIAAAYASTPPGSFASGGRA